MGTKNFFVWSSAAVILLCFSTQYSSGLQLAENGGYKIVVAVEEDVALPPGTTIPEFINKIQAALRSFTHILFTTTEKFHLASVELVLPRSWPNDTPGVGDASAAHTVASSDIRLSKTDTFPYVENPNACGLPGQYIQLPVDFFQPGNTLDGKFGSPAKALLTQWARFRWGAWEEHGYPEDSKFPYFYHGANDESWLANSCSNDEIHGHYHNIETGIDCNVNQPDPLHRGCRFIPDVADSQNNNVSSSLMSFPWLESVVKFCDEASHNKAAPNRQNVFCNYQSITEVIRQTPDYAAVTLLQDFAVPSLTFKTVQHKAAPEVTKPPLFILIDKGYRETHATTALSMLMTQLAKMLLGDEPVGETTPLPDYVVVSGGVFPGGSGDVMSTSLAWAPLEQSRDEMFEFFTSAVEFGGSYTRNFIDAISQVIRKIEFLSPENGAMILVVKTGSPGNSYFDRATTSEVEIETALKQNNIKLFAVEITDGKPGSVSTHLQGLTSRTSGAHSFLVDITDPKNPEKAAEIVALGIEIALASSNSAQKILVAHKGSITLNAPESQQVILRRKSTVKVTLVAPHNLAARLQIAGLPPGSGYPGPLPRESNEWGVQSRQNHVFEFNHVNDEATTLNVTYTCAEVGACAADELAFLYVTETFAGDDEDLPVIAKVKVTAASRPETRIEFTSTTVPYAVSVKVEYDGRPVKNAVVMATATYGNPATEVVFELLDNGNGYSDGVQFDGIYSAHFVPPVDGSYSITVDVKRNSEAIPRLLPIDQDEFGCISCNAVDLPEDMEIRDIQLPTVTFAKVEAYPGRGQPEKVMDFNVTRSAARTGVDFKFLPPSLIGNSTVKAARYTIYAASTLKELLPPTEALIFATFTSTEEEMEEFSVTVINPSLLYFGIVAHAPPPDEKQSAIFIQRIDLKAEGIIGTTTSTTPPTGDGSTTSPPLTDPEDDDKPFFETAGGIVVIVLLVLILVGGAAGGGFWYWKKKQRRGHVSGSRA